MFIETNTGNYHIKVLSSHELTNDNIQQWSALEERAVEGNVYLSPYFILPSLKYLSPQARTFIVFVEKNSDSIPKLCGVGVFECCRGTKKLPLPHLKAYCSPHSYLSGLLVDEQYMEPTLEAFFTFFSSLRKYSYGIEFKNRTASTRLAKQFEITASRFGVSWIQYDRKQRSILVPHQLEEDYLERFLSSKMRKNIRRFQKLLSEKGTIDWHLLSGRQIGLDSIDRFLNLEHMGWKGTKGSSLLSNPKDEAFFREMITSFAQNGRAFITELSVNNQVIASTSNLISSKMGYAFKIGWDTQFAQASPGILNEVEFIKRAAGSLPHLEYIDSGADEGSFIDKLWHDRYDLVSGFYITKTLSRSALATINCIRHMKRWIATK